MIATGLSADKAKAALDQADGHLRQVVPHTDSERRP